MGIEGIEDDTYTPHADCSTWFLLGILFNNDPPLNSFSFFDIESDRVDKGELNRFLKIGIHQLPQEIFKVRTKVDEVLYHWINKLQLRTTIAPPLDHEVRASSGVYYWADSQGTPTLVIKPLDEDIGCLNNPNDRSGLPGVEIRVRQAIPLYQGPMRATASSRICQSTGCTVIPKTELAAVFSPDFYDITDALRKGKWDKILKMFHLEKKVAHLINNCGVPSWLKLCSVREYVPHATTLSNFLQTTFLSIEESDRLPLIDPTDLEMVNIWMWITGNTDGHLANVLVYPKVVKPGGEVVFGLKLIDVCLTFPEANVELQNSVPDLFKHSPTLSEEGVAFIDRFPTEEVVKILENYELDKTVAAFRERMEVLRALAHTGMTTIEIDTRMKYLHLGKEAVLCPCFDEPRFDYETSSGKCIATQTETSWLHG